MVDVYRVPHVFPALLCALMLQASVPQHIVAQTGTGSSTGSSTGIGTGSSTGIVTSPGSTESNPAELPNSPASILSRSRAMASHAQAVTLLEKALPRSGSLKPWFLLELVIRTASSDKWKESLGWAELMDVGSFPEEIADASVWWKSEALRQNGKPDSSAALLLSRLETGKSSEPAVYLAYFRTGSSRSEEVLARFDASFPSIKHTDPGSYYASRYLAGLCAVREADWEFALSVLTRFSETAGSYLSDYQSWASAYRAYSLYRLGRFDQSAAAFSLFLDTWKLHPYGWQAAMTGALASVQAGGDPLPFTDQALNRAPNGASYAEAAILRASILADRKDFDRAEAILKGVADGSATKSRTAFAPRALFMLGEIAARTHRPELAEQQWTALASSWPKDPLAEEAVFRAGENWYIAGNLPRALSLFTRYRQTWISGKYLDLVLRNGGDAHSRTGATDLAILWWEDLVRKYPDSSAIPRAYSELVAAYRKKHEYEAAIWTAQQYRNTFPEEATLDDMDAEIATLTKLKNGENPSSASLYVDWTRASRASTSSGRALGLRLARTYLDDYSKRGEAAAVLAEIAAEMPAKTDRLSGPEKNTYAAVWSLLGNLHREDGDYAQASKDLLTAGTLYASTDGERAAEALYGAVDCFLQNGKSADARSAADTLESSWPDSVWTRRAILLIETTLKDKGV